MTEKSAKKLVNQYVLGWLRNDADKIVKPLAKNCMVIESHGPTYNGHQQIRKWVEYWLEAKGKVKKWKIKSFYYLPKKQTALFEWDFACRVRGKNYQIPGLSIVKFKNNKIVLIHEYRMTKKAYVWRGKQLNAD